MIVDHQDTHSLLPYLHSFRCVLLGHDDDYPLYQALAHFVERRPRLRRLDLGSCPWELVSGALPGLTGLRVFRIKTGTINENNLGHLVKQLPSLMVAIHVGVLTSTRSLVSLDA